MANGKAKLQKAPNADGVRIAKQFQNRTVEFVYEL